MSVLSRFQDHAQIHGLKTMGSPTALRGSATYTSFLQGRLNGKARLDALASRYLGTSAARTDSAGRRMTADQVATRKAETFAWADALAKLQNDGVRADALVPQASQATTFFYQSVMEYAHADLPAWEGKILPIDRRPDRAAENYVWYEMDLVGVPRAASSYSKKDIPIVEGPMGQANYGAIVPFLLGMEINFMDMRRSALAKLNGKPDFQIDANKAKMCMRGLAEACHFLWMFGDAQSGIDGLMNHPAIGTLSIVGAWSGKTALQILADLNSMVNVIPNTTQGQLSDMSRIKIMLPPDQYNLANSQPVTSASSESILSFFKKTWSLRDDQVVREYSFAASNSQIYIGGPQGLQRDRAVIFYDQKDPDRDPSFILSQDVEIPAPPSQSGLAETTFYHVRAGGCKVPDARGIRFAEGL